MIGEPPTRGEGLDQMFESLGRLVEAGPSFALAILIQDQYARLLALDRGERPDGIAKAPAAH